MSGVFFRWYVDGIRLIVPHCECCIVTFECDYEDLIAGIKKL